jgi:hypothetical protein
MTTPHGLAALALDALRVGPADLATLARRLRLGPDHTPLRAALRAEKRAGRVRYVRGVWSLTGRGLEALQAMDRRDRPRGTPSPAEARQQRVPGHLIPDLE